jgi:hypothetical protein
MTSAVLKNRMLSLTNQAFSERDFGAQTFTEFLGRFPEVVRIDRTQLPFVIDLLGVAPEESGDVTRPLIGKPRVRKDLWDAVLDFRSGVEHIWDKTTSRARPRGPDDGDDAEVLPTASSEELSKWRDAFRRQVESRPIAAVDRDDPRLRIWAEKGLGTGYLPVPYRGPWNEFMRNAVVAKLSAWFDSREIDKPSDLIEVAVVPPRLARDGNLYEALNELLSRLTKDEIAQLTLPAQLVLRALRDRKS